MLKTIPGVCVLFYSTFIFSQSLYFPPINGSTWETISPVELGWCENEIEPLLDYLKENESKAFILLKDGKIVIEKYFDSYTQDSIWYWASAGKSMTGFLMGLAQQESLLSISEMTSKYLGPAWTVCPLDKENLITVKHQLSMTTGLDDKVADIYCTLNTCLQFRADAGTRWAYHNAPYTLLDEVIESASGQNLNSFLSQRLRGQTGIIGLYVKSGYNNVLYSKPRMMARFGLLMLNKGNWNGTSILHDANYYQAVINSSQSINKSYGYLWWLNGKESYMVPGVQYVYTGSMNPNAPNDMFSALGKNGQILNVVPSQNLVLIRMGDDPGAGDVPINFNDEIWKRVNKVICNTTQNNDEKTKDKNITCFINFASKKIDISVPNEYFSIKLVDLNGNVIFGKEHAYNQINIPTLKFASGLYYILIQPDIGHKFQKKLLILN
ncbi:MAG: serine hydrolase [Bacteroidota bacterium]|nr:serine hydrolase [Bacteroidota bacterium]